MAAPVLSKVHTFAQDLAEARLQRDNGENSRISIPNNTDATAEESPIPTNRIESPKNQAITTAPRKSPTTPIKLATTASRDASYPATIITDKKSNRFNLTAEMSNAIGSWWQEKVSGLQKKKKPTYRIPAVEHRKGIVSTATTKTGRAVATDYRDIVTKLKQEPVTIPPEEPLAKVEMSALATPVETPTVQWETESKPTTRAPIVMTMPDEPTLETPITSEPLFETTEITPTTTAETEALRESRGPIVVTAVTTRKNRIEPVIPDMPTNSADEAHLADESGYDNSAVDLPIDSTDNEPIIPAIPVTPSITPVKTFEKITPTIPRAVRESASEVTPRRENAFSLLGEIPAPTKPAVPEYVKATIAERMEAKREQGTLPVARINGLRRFAPYIAGFIFLAVTGGSIAYLSMGTESVETPITSTDLPTDYIPKDNIANENPISNTVSAQLDAPNKGSLYAAIKATAGLGDGLHIVTPLAYDTALPLSTREVLALLNRQFVPAFVGTINSIELGMYREDPVIMIRVSDKATALGGMYAWEKTIGQDLSPWFGVALRTTSTTSLSGFVDSQSANRDVRILKDDIGTERITYGFINDTTILVTTNSTAFLNIADQ
jgi:hypothetical protein